MVRRLYIAEKPSLGREIAKAVSAITGASQSNGQGLIKVGQDTVTWTRGHAFENAKPEEYDPILKSWRLDTLPFVPTDWKMSARQDMSGEIKAISQCLREKPDEIVHVGDAEREGQLIIDEILMKYGIDPFGASVKRVWIQSMTDTAIQKAVREAFPNAEKRNLSHAAIARQRADWVHGLNATRAFAIVVRQAGVDGVEVRVGRVQTPTLKLVVDRDREIENFKPVDHFIPAVIFQHENGSFKASWIMPEDTPGQNADGQLLDKAVAQAVIDRVAGKTGSLSDIQKAPKSTPPPLAFSLGTLQKACFRRFGMQLEETDEAAQKLYEAKLTSYPRTGSEYLPTTLLAEEAPLIIANLMKAEALGDMAAQADLKRRSPVWNDAKVTDHYGIVPTTEATASKIASLSGNEKRVFMLIAKTFIAQFYPDYRYESTVATVSVPNGERADRFKANGKRIVDLGWKKVFGAELDEEDEKEEAEGSLPAMAKGDAVEVRATELGPKRTKPPAHFDDASLVDAMMTIHRFVSNPQIKQQLKENSGLGTDATRKAIVTKLIDVGHIVRKPKGKKSIIMSTPLGRALIDLLPKKVSSPELTAFWETYLEKIKDGEFTLERFMAEQERAIRILIDEAKTQPVNIAALGVKPLPGHGDTCPECQKGTLRTRTWPFDDAFKGKRYLRCDNFVKDDPSAQCRYRGRPEGFKEAPKHPDEGKTCTECGKGTMTSRVSTKKGPNAGRPFISCSAIDFKTEGGCRNFAWTDVEKPSSPDDGKPCPNCGKGQLQSGIVQKDGPNKGRSYIRCSAADFTKDDACKHFAWTSEQKIRGRPIAGEGQPCPKCGKGKMMRRTITKDGPNKGKAFLACNNWTRGASDNCDHAIFPDRKDPPAKAGNPSKGKAPAPAPQRRRA